MPHSGILASIWIAAEPWFLNHGLRILGIVIAAFIARSISVFFVEKAVRRTVAVRRDGSSNDGAKRRADTLVNVFSDTINIGVWTVAGVMIIAEFGMNIGPILAAAGVAGVALGFGAQYVIRDLIAGFFIVLENQYRVGDWVSVGDISGVVEDLTLRRTVLRDMDGTAHFIPNGEIKIASNQSRRFASVNLNVGIGYDSDLDAVIRVVNRVGRELADDAAWKDSIITPPQFLRIHEFGDSAIVIKITGNTKPMRQWDVTGELRKRLKAAFDRERIELPFPQRVIHRA